MGDLTPTPSVAKTMDFPEAVRQMMDGKKITRISWANSDYGVLQDGFIRIFINGQLKQWLISDGDVEGQDWVVVQQN